MGKGRETTEAQRSAGGTQAGPPSPRGSAFSASAWILLLAAGCASSGSSPPPPPPPRPAPAVTAPLSSAPERTSEPAVPEESAPAPAPEPAAPAAGEGEAARPAEKSPPADARSEDPPLGWVAGSPIEAEELLVEWGDVAARELWLLIDKLVASRLALAEAARLSIRLPPEAVEERFAEERKKLEEQVARSAKGRTLEQFIAQELGFEPARYLERVRRATIRQMLAERAVRSNSLAGESVALRLIVVLDEERMQEVQEKLAAGADFAEVASEFSVDDSRAQGGFVPFVVPQEGSALSSLAFQTPVGESAGPVPIADHIFLIRVEERRTPITGDWAAIEETVEASLAEHPVEDSEFLNWKLAMERRYPIDLGPLGRLLGVAR